MRISRVYCTGSTIHPASKPHLFSLFSSFFFSSKLKMPRCLLAVRRFLGGFCPLLSLRSWPHPSPLCAVVTPTNECEMNLSWGWRVNLILRTSGFGFWFALCLFSLFILFRFSGTLPNTTYINLEKETPHTLPRILTLLPVGSYVLALFLRGIE